MKKELEERTATELYFTELYNLVHDLEKKLKKIQALADEAYFKASISHSLIVVRKVQEDKVDDLNKILD